MTGGTALFCGLALLLMLPGSALASPSAPIASSYAPHAPIQVIGDNAFNSIAGVVGGSGTAADPFVISGWDINASQATGQFAGTGIFVENTRASFVIQNVYVHDGGYAGFGGIRLINVTNAVVLNANVSRNSYGVTVMDSANATVRALASFQNRNGAVWAQRDQGISVEDGSWPADGQGNVLVEQSDRVDVLNNTVGSFIGLYGVANATVSNNTVVASGIDASASADVTITDNVLEGSTTDPYAAVSVTQSTRVEVSGNSVTTEAYCGVCLVDSTFVHVSGNVVQGGGVEVWGDTLEQYTTQEITPDNTANGKPVLFVKDQAFVRVGGEGLGQVIVVNSTGVEVSGMDTNGVSMSIQLAYVTNGMVSLNRVVDVTRHWMNGGMGIVVHQSRAVWVFGNEVQASSVAIEFDRSEDLIAGGNQITSANGSGLMAYKSDGVTLLENNVTDSWSPVYLWESSNVTVYHNNFVRSEEAPFQFGGSHIAWDNGYPAGGNYWSSYTGPDACGGASQTDCSRSDGIIDTPYVINATMEDRYPLAKPVPLQAMPSPAPVQAPPWGFAAVGLVLVVAVAFLAWYHRLRGGRAPTPPGSAPPKESQAEAPLPPPRK